jgi:hypothetical protein
LGTGTVDRVRLERLFLVRLHALLIGGVGRIAGERKDCSHAIPIVQCWRDHREAVLSG